jgi:hypothetical protein
MLKKTMQGTVRKIINRGRKFLHQHPSNSTGINQKNDEKTPCARCRKVLLNPKQNPIWLVKSRFNAKGHGCLKSLSSHEEKDS